MGMSSSIITSNDFTLSEPTTWDSMLSRRKLREHRKAAADTAKKAEISAIKQNMQATFSLSTMVAPLLETPTPAPAAVVKDTPVLVSNATKTSSWLAAVAQKSGSTARLPPPPQKAASTASSLSPQTPVATVEKLTPPQAPTKPDAPVVKKDAEVDTCKRTLDFSEPTPSKEKAPVEDPLKFIIPDGASLCCTACVVNFASDQLFNHLKGKKHAKNVGMPTPAAVPKLRVEATEFKPPAPVVVEAKPVAAPTVAVVEAKPVAAPTVAVVEAKPVAAPKPAVTTVAAIIAAKPVLATKAASVAGSYKPRTYPPEQQAAYMAALNKAKAAFFKQCAPTSVEVQDLQVRCEHIMGWRQGIRKLALDDFEPVQVGAAKVTFNRLKFAQNPDFVDYVKDAYKDNVPGCWVSTRIIYEEDKPFFSVRIGNNL